MTGEYFGRDAANVAWIEDTFAKAATTHAPALVFAFQADPLFQVDPKSGLTYANSGFANTLKAFATGAESFKKPVLLIHGDTHIFIVDQPLKAADGKSVLENVYRLEVMGADKVQAVRVHVQLLGSGRLRLSPTNCAGQSADGRPGLTHSTAAGGPDRVCAGTPSR